MYARGEGTPQNYTAAVQWYKRAAESGETQAMYELGKLYLAGGSLPRDPQAALVWFQIGARFGAQQCQSEAAKLAPTLTNKQRTAAGSTANHWISHHSAAQKEEAEEEKKGR